MLRFLRLELVAEVWLNLNINLPLTHNKEFSDDCQERYERARMTVQIAKQKVLGFCHDKGIV